MFSLFFASHVSGEIKLYVLGLLFGIQIKYPLLLKLSRLSIQMLKDAEKRSMLEYLYSNEFQYLQAAPFSGQLLRLLILSIE